MFPSDIITLFISLFFIFIISIIFSIFSPLGILFVVFTIVRHKTENLSLKKVSLVFQIILLCLTFIIGFLLSLLFLVRGAPFYMYGSEGWIYTLSVIMGVGFMTLVNIGIIIFQTKSINDNLAFKQNTRSR